MTDHEQAKSSLVNLVSLLNKSAKDDHGEIIDGENNSFIVQYNYTRHGYNNAAKLLYSLKDGGFLTEQNLPSSKEKEPIIHFAKVKSQYVDAKPSGYQVNVILTPNGNYSHFINGLE